ncbi:glycosyl transferase group 1 [Candidatus Termititenax persephonae]|uniref:Glycosyl transferase group 1 n=1 Tax=Candidatus Termititenax persephonae TaxID=2218525 RepID=A0A388TFM5_9BACT|nr:glycosyl transferase group 1 [Candidatus Termititenax persephonae]
MTRILRIIARLNIGGPALHVTNLNYYLDHVYGCESLLVHGSLAKGEGSMEYLASAKNLKTIVLPELGRELNPWRDLKTIWRLYRIIKRAQPDIVHTHTAKAGAVGRLAAQLAGVKKIYHTFHGHVLHSYFGKFKTRIFILLEKILARLTTKIIAISERQRAELLSFGIAPAEKITVIRLGFELNKLTPCQNYWRTKYRLPPDLLLVGIVGRLVPVKNHEYFLSIAQEVCRQTAAVRFILIGDGELRAKLEIAVREKGLQDRVFFAGFLTEPKEIYSDLDIVVLTSRNEGTPVTLIEAMACGKPVVSTEVGGVADIIDDGRTGCLAPQNQPVAFAEKILRLSADQTLRESLGQKAREKILALYDVQRLAADIYALYTKPSSSPCGTPAG